MTPTSLSSSFIGNSNISLTVAAPFSLSLSETFHLSFLKISGHGNSPTLLPINPSFLFLLLHENSGIIAELNMVDSSSHLPRWLEALLREKFFNACIIHEEAKKNEKNIFCLDCCEGICPHCLSPHRSHRLLQIRRYVYHDVIRLGDAEKLMDCGFVQSYTTNSAKVVFLNQRPQTRPCRGSGSICITCDRGLQDPYIFCSLSCKLQHILGTNGASLSKYIFECEYLTLSEPALDDGQMTPDSVLELRTSSGSSGSGGAGGGVDCRTLGCTATTEAVVRKKRSNVSVFRTSFPPVCSPASEISASLMNRRKGTPHRSPLY